jgi:hypothetical protein
MPARACAASLACTKIAMGRWRCAVPSRVGLAAIRIVGNRAADRVGRHLQPSPARRCRVPRRKHRGAAAAHGTGRRRCVFLRSSWRRVSRRSPGGISANRRPGSRPGRDSAECAASRRHAGIVSAWKCRVSGRPRLPTRCGPGPDPPNAWSGHDCLSHSVSSCKIYHSRRGAALRRLDGRDAVLVVDFLIFHRAQPIHFVPAPQRDLPLRPDARLIFWLF